MSDSIIFYVSFLIKVISICLVLSDLIKYHSLMAQTFPNEPNKQILPHILGANSKFITA